MCESLAAADLLSGFPARAFNLGSTSVQKDWPEERVVNADLPHCLCAVLAGLCVVLLCAVICFSSLCVSLSRLVT